MKPPVHSPSTLLSLKHLDIDKIAFEFARNHCGPKNPVEVLLLDCEITALQFAALADDTLFQRKVREFVKELTENGTSFALKARVLAEDLLTTNYKLAKNTATPPSVAEKLIANTVRWAGLEKKADTDSNPLGGGPKISINISLGDTPLQAPVASIIIDAVPQPTPPQMAPPTEEKGEVP